MAIGRKDPEIHWFVAVMVYQSYALLIAFGHMRDILGSLFGFSRYTVVKKKEKQLASLLKSTETFYTRRLYHRIQDCWNRPIASNPGGHIEVMERSTMDNNFSLQTTGKTNRCLNLGSYNYLGFADDWKTTCKDNVMCTLHEYPVSTCASRCEYGNLCVHDTVEKTVANFLRKEAAVVYTMGYNTNTTTIPVICTPGTLLVSDTLNHTSIVNGARASPALVRVFKHNDPASLEDVLRESIVNGQPRFNRPWKKIIVLVEGIYSMEGAICNLKGIVKVCKRYKTYLYVDEAHSIGALGRTGRGVCEYDGVDPEDIDVLMGTFTKSFGGMGGYIAGSKELIDYIKESSAGFLHHNAMSPVVCQQIITSLNIINGKDGTNTGSTKLRKLRENSNFFRREMEKIGMHVYGDYDSPIIPCLIYFPAKIAAFSRECLLRKLAVVVVGFPATSVVLSRVRFCISAGHSIEDLTYAVKQIDDIASIMCLKYSSNFLGSPIVFPKSRRSELPTMQDEELSHI